MSCFVLRLELESPAILGRRLTLDGLLGGILWHRHNDLAMLERLPLDKREGVWLASQAFIEGPLRSVPMGEWMQARSLRLQTVFEPWMLRREKNGAYQRIKTDDDEFKNVLSPRFPTIFAKAVWFVGRGDAAAVARLLDGASIGKRRGIGFGSVRQIEMDEFAPSHAWHGAVGAGGEVLRPIPAELVARIESEIGLRLRDYSQAVEAWQAPYWLEDRRVTCAVPEKNEWREELAVA